MKISRFSLACLVISFGRGNLTLCQVVSRDSSVSVVTTLRAGRPEFDSQQGHGSFLFTTASKPALGPT